MKEGVARSYEGLFRNRFPKDDILKMKKFNEKDTIENIFDNKCFV